MTSNNTVQYKSFKIQIDLILMWYKSVVEEVLLGI